MLGDFCVAATCARLCPPNSAVWLSASRIAVAKAVPKRARSGVGGGGTGHPPPTVELALIMYPIALATCTQLLLSNSAGALQTPAAALGLPCWLPTCCCYMVQVFCSDVQSCTCLASCADGLQRKVMLRSALSSQPCCCACVSSTGHQQGARRSAGCWRCPGPRSGQTRWA